MNKTLLIIVLVLSLLSGSIAGIWIYKKFFERQKSDRATLEKVLKIKELHLVQHVYEDLFFLHRKNNPNKAVRAIAQVPVKLNAFIDLDKALIIRQGDSIHQIKLPMAQLDEPNYMIDKMIVKSVKNFQFHIGTDLYGGVLNYVQQIVEERKESIKQKAIRRDILTQTENEAIAYFKSILFSFNKDYIEVVVDKPVTSTRGLTKDSTKEMDTVEFNFIGIENLDELLENH
ncbi:MAG: DUF4230 domain-containing protein [Bacteroidota bacterium]